MKNRTGTRDERSANAVIAIANNFEELRATSETAGPAWLQPAREKAFTSFRYSGFPRAKEEDWKYTNLAGFAERSATYLKNGTKIGHDHTIKTLLTDLPRADDEIRLVFANGLYRPDLSNTDNPDPGVELTPYSTVEASNSDKILHDLTIDQNALIALNTAFLCDGLAIDVAEDSVANTPIHVIFVADGQNTAIQPRLSINAGRNSAAHIIQHYVGTGESLTNSVTTIRCAEYSRLFYVRLQNESMESMHVTNQIVSVAANGSFEGVNIDLGGRLVRNNLTVNLQGSQAQASLHGLFMANGKRHADNHLRVEHRAPDTTSVENYRGILNDTARGVFNGQIIVHPGADGTDAQMSNRNLLLSEQSEIDTKPELEIYTDDVKCAHGATTGQLDMDSLFYLRARGVPETMARTMLIGAFAQEIIDHVEARSPLLAKHINKQMHNQLPDNNQTCLLQTKQSNQ